MKNETNIKRLTEEEKTRYRYESNPIGKEVGSCEGDLIADFIGDLDSKTEYIFPRRIRGGFFDGLLEVHSYEPSIGPKIICTGFDLWRPLIKKPIALDFMGTMNDPQAKNLMWTAIQNALAQGNTEPLRASGMTPEQIAHFQEHIRSTGCKPMQLRDYVLAVDGMKSIIGTYTSIGAEAGQLDEICRVYDDAVDFLTIAKALGHPVEIFSTIGAPKGYRDLAEIMLSKRALPEDYRAFLQCFGEQCQTAYDLVGQFVVSKKKKSEPGQAVLEETAAKGLYAYVDDEREVIDDAVNVFAAQTERILPVLCRIERPGLKDAGYKPAEKHIGIEKLVVAKSLMDKRLLNALYCQGAQEETSRYHSENYPGFGDTLGGLSDA